MFVVTIVGRLSDLYRSLQTRGTKQHCLSCLALREREQDQNKDPAITNRCSICSLEIYEGDKVQASVLCETICFKNTHLFCQLSALEISMQLMYFRSKAASPPYTISITVCYYICVKFISVYQTVTGFSRDVSVRVSRNWNSSVRIGNGLRV